MFNDREKLYTELEEDRSSKLIVYVTGDRKGLETQMHSEILDYFIDHLDSIGHAEKVSLYMYTRGGNPIAAWSIVNLIRQFCENFEVILPSKCHSAGTLLALGADAIMMTKQATLGPIDPSVNGPLNPQIPGAPPTVKAPVSVEAIKGFIEFSKDEMGISLSDNLINVLINLANKVHPLVLGEVYRTRAQIRMLGRKLLANQVTEEEKIEKILSFLCSDSGSHDYTIFRREAKDNLGLNILKPNDTQYQMIKSIYDDIANELKLSVPYDHQFLLGTENSSQYSFRRALVESKMHGSHVFISEGQLNRKQVPVSPQVMQEGIEDRRIFEGWKHENI